MKDNKLVNIINNEIIISGEFTKKVIEFEKLKKEIEYQEELLKNQLLEIMPKVGKSTIINNGLSITYKHGSIRKTLDVKKLEEELPNVYNVYLKESQTKDSIIIKVSD